MTSTPPRTRLSPSARRESILRVALAAFARAPYAQVSVSGIAAQAGVSEALVHRYFEGKPGLYAEVVAAASATLLARQQAAEAALPLGAPARERVKAALHAYLDHITDDEAGWSAPFRATGNEPESALELRRGIRADYVQRLANLLGPDPGPRRTYALWGYFGFIDAACAAWVERGMPDDERHALVEAALGALEGALGDWGR
ncbi:TetR/AcrR family transcriptional regulator [Gephyromycinifex aptenodytis]|uniref:TetR/AcrR family transcriptional regulator n=1 Tax=Gephyromycinifex aptenodytis TaxID=2716227 RepID=UPI0014470F45|nr:TetR/AcrR family transcriptional regulator [Gephyromycinifex aptenodytis]